MAVLALLGLGLGAHGCHSEPIRLAEPAPAEAGARPVLELPLRRLSRFELLRSLSDLVGQSSDGQAEAPEDEPSLGFDNNADVYSVSALHASRYHALAEAAAAQLIADRSRLSAFAGCDPLESVDCRRAFFLAFGRRALRRPLTQEELAAFVGQSERLADSGAGPALAAAVASMLEGPAFLYRLESSGDTQSELDAYALATRLAFLVTASAPDAELLDAAEAGELASESGFREQGERLLALGSAGQAFEHFVWQWWDLGSLPFTEKDRSLYRTWSADVRSALATQVTSFVAAAWSARPTLAELFTSSRTFLSPTLAGFYGVSPPAGDGFSAVELATESSAGLFTHGAFLAVHARPDQSSPVLRGKFVRERLLCQPLPPPPPGAAVEPPRVDPRLSTRQRFATHTSAPACATCHELMDPIGFGFEAFDAVGVPRQVDAGELPDTRGELVDTDVDGPFVGVRELGLRLLSSQEVTRCVASTWFRYAFGRGERAGDVGAIDTLAGALDASGGDFKELMRATLALPEFRAVPSKRGAP